MPWSQISRGARTAVVERLANVSTGFNPNLALAMADADIEAPAGWKLPIVFEAPTFNFWQADIAPAELDPTSPVTYPSMALFSKRSANENADKFRLFAGPVNLTLCFFASWMSSKALPDFETIGDCVEEALVQTFNSDAPDIVSWATGPNILYNGDIAISRSKLSRDTESWYQDYVANLVVEVFANTAS
jgi:hypothetical protein